MNALGAGMRLIAAFILLMLTQPLSASDFAQRIKLGPNLDRVILPNGLNFELPNIIPTSNDLMTDLGKLNNENNANLETITEESHYFRGALKMGLKEILSVAVDPAPYSERRLGQDQVSKLTDEQLEQVRGVFASNYKVIAERSDTEVFVVEIKRVDVNDKYFIRVTSVWELNFTNSKHRILQIVDNYFDYENSLILSTKGLVGLADEVTEIANQLTATLEFAAK